MYSITNLSKEQLKIISKALDLYTRIGLGQIEAIASVLLFESGFNDAFIKEPLLEQYKKEATGFDRGQSYGITNDKVKQQFKEAYSMCCVLQKEIAKGTNKNSAWHDGNVLKLNKEPEIEIVGE